jgi:hypothetical protein
MKIKNDSGGEGLLKKNENRIDLKLSNDVKNFIEALVAEKVGSSRLIVGN